MNSMETQIQQLAQLQSNPVQLNPQQLPDQLFSMPKGAEFEMPNIKTFLKLKDGNVIVITLGVILSSTVGGFLTQFFPGGMTKWASVIAGALIMFIGKNKGVIQDFGAGVLIGGLAQVFSGLGGMIGSGMSMPMNRQVEEDKLTYGGGDGVYPTQPDRRVFQ